MSIAEHLERSMKKHMGKAKSKGEPRIKSMEIEKGADGDGYIVTHHFHQSTMGGGGASYHDSEKHAMKSHHELIKHVKEHMCPDLPEPRGKGKKNPSDVEETADVA
jgi:hypothetical protein